MEWKNLAEEAAAPSGSSSRTLCRLIRETLWKYNYLKQINLVFLTVVGACLDLESSVEI